MPLFEKFTPNAHSTVGLWRITENIEELQSMITLTADENERFFSFQSNERKKQWLSYRVLLNLIINKPKQSISVYYDEYGRPYIKPSIANISITHSGEFSGIILSDNKAVGIDVEKITPRIINISHKFISEREAKQVDLNDIMQLTIYWCAKEAMYKLHGARNITFKENIFVNPFLCCENEGSLNGVIENKGCLHNISLIYKKINEYILVFTADN